MKEVSPGNVTTGTEWGGGWWPLKIEWPGRCYLGLRTVESQVARHVQTWGEDHSLLLLMISKPGAWFYSEVEAVRPLWRELTSTYIRHGPGVRDSLAGMERSRRTWGIQKVLLMRTSSRYIGMLGFLPPFCNLINLDILLAESAGRADLTQVVVLGKTSRWRWRIRNRW